MLYKKRKRLIYTIITILLIIDVALAAFYIWKIREDHNKVPDNNTTTLQPDSPSTVFLEGREDQYIFENLIYDFASAWEDFINQGDLRIMDYLKPGSDIQKDVEAYKKKDETKEFSRIKVNNINVNGNTAIISVYERIYTGIIEKDPKTNDWVNIGGDFEIHNWLYQAEKINNEWKLVSYVPDTSDAAQYDEAIKTWQQVNTPAEKTINKVAVGDGHRAMVTENGELWMWGENSLGQIGDGTRVDRKYPIKVMDNIKDVVLQDFYTVALKNDGEVLFWGGHYVGTAWSSYTSEPLHVKGDTVAISSNPQSLISLDQAGDAWATPYKNSESALISPKTSFIIGNKIRQLCGYTLIGENDIALAYYNYEPESKEGAPKVTPIMKNIQHADSNLLLTKDNALWDVGNNCYGQGSQIQPVQPVKLMDDVKQASSSCRHSAAISQRGELWMWGEGQKSDTPSITLDSGIKAVETRANRTILLLENGQVEERIESFEIDYDV